MPALAHMFRLSLVLMLALTLSHATVARGHGGTIAGWIALCVGEDVVSVAVDGTGAPVTPHVPCPDCITGGAALVAAGPLATAPMQLAGRMSRLAPWQFSLSFVLISPAARGPPAFV